MTRRCILRSESSTMVELPSILLGCQDRSEAGNSDPIARPAWIRALGRTDICRWLVQRIVGVLRSPGRINGLLPLAPLLLCGAAHAVASDLELASDAVDTQSRIPSACQEEVWVLGKIGFYLACVVFAVCLSAPEQATAQEMAQFGDWQTWCDNLRRCTAAVEKTESGLIIARDGDAMATPTVGIRLYGRGSSRNLEAMHLRINGRPAPGIGMLLGNGGMYWSADVTGQQAFALIQGMTNAPLLQVETQHGGTYDISLKGLAATLRWIDDRQKRVGTITALVARGPVTAATIPLPPSVPDVTRPSMDGLTDAPDASSVLPALREAQLFSGCAPAAITNEDRLSVGRLVSHSPHGQLLWVKPCKERPYDVDPRRSREFRAITTNYDGLGVQEVSLPYPASMKAFSADTATNVALSFYQKEQQIVSTKHYVGLAPDGRKVPRAESDRWLWNGEAFVPVEVTLIEECGYHQEDCRNRWVSTTLYRAVIHESQ